MIANARATLPISLLLWTDIPAAHEADFNEWYNREHMPDRVLGIPGFIQARRFVATEGAPKYAVLYEVVGPEVFRNEAYLAMRRTPDARSRQFIPLFRNVIRFTGQPLAQAQARDGVAEGAWVRFSAFHASGNADEAWQQRVTALVRCPGIVRACVFGAARALSEGAASNTKGTPRASLRGPDQLPDVLVMIEASAEEHLVAVDAEVNAAVTAQTGWTPAGSARMRQMIRVAPG